MVHRSVPTADLEAAADELVSELASGPTVSLGLSKWLLHTGGVSDLGTALSNEALALEISSRSKDFKEGLAAFREKRQPDFRGH
jgi:2-(1,2-epoxy-1,2-dihydrophenyl)acetyl-CoA isomerase